MKVGHSDTSLRSAAVWRAEALARFAAWESAHPMPRTPAEAIAAAGWLYDLLPAEARRPSLRYDGVIKLHRALSVLSHRR